MSIHRIRPNHASLPVLVNETLRDQTMASAMLEDLVPAHLPPVFRIVSIDSAPVVGGRTVTTTAVIFHERAAYFAPS